MNHILVTGGAGFIGSHVIDRLVGEGTQVTALDNFSSGNAKNLASQVGLGLGRLFEGDIRDRSKVNEVLQGVEKVVHLAAMADHEACLRNPELANEVNAKGTLALLEGARKNDVTRFVYASSAALYGEPRKLPISEGAELTPLAPYGVSKLAGERYCFDFMKDYGLKVICLRFFNVFGPRQTARQYSGVVTEFMKNLSKGQPPAIHGDGLQSRDFVNIKDIVEAIILALDSKGAKGVYNIATGKETTINELADTLIKISNQSVNAVHVSARSGDIRRSVADISKAKTQLHFTPRTDLEKDLRELWNWEQENPSDT